MSGKRDSNLIAVDIGNSRLKAGRIMRGRDRPPVSSASDLPVPDATLDLTIDHATGRFDEKRLAELIGRSYDRSFYPEGTLRQWAAIMASPPRTERLKALKVPALVLHGSSDTLIPPAAGRHTAQTIAGSEHHEIEGWGHDLPLEVIPILHDFIVPFIQRVEAGRAKQAA